MTSLKITDRNVRFGHKATLPGDRTTSAFLPKNGHRRWPMQCRLAVTGPATLPGSCPFALPAHKGIHTIGKAVRSRPLPASIAATPLHVR